MLSITLYAKKLNLNLRLYKQFLNILLFTDEKKSSKKSYFPNFFSIG